MPIHDQSYRRYAGSKVAPGQAWSVIAYAGIRGMIRRRIFLALLFASWIPFIVFAVRIYFAANYPQLSPIAMTPESFRSFLGFQGLFPCFLVTIWAGAGLIANDRRANALQIYLSKPLMRVEYIAGKFAVLATFLLVMTWVPGILLLMLQILFSGSFTFARQNLFLFPAITVASFMYVIVVSFAMLALSSLSKSSRYVGILYAGVMFFTGAVFAVLRLILGGTGASWISLVANLAQVTDVIFRLTPRYETPWTVSLLALVGVVVVSISVLERRVRGVEVVT
jgi:ABC-type transport system involved in multi-copper enzyme maturation permease subunit